MSERNLSKPVVGDVLAAPPAEVKTEAGQMLAMIDRAIANNQDPGKLLDVYERLRTLRAEQEFKEAMMRFRETCPPIPRRTESTQFQVMRNGVKSNRRYATLEDIERTIRTPLAECGLSFRWTGAAVANGHLSMVCVVSHVGGHSESSPVVFPIESKAGSSEQQKFGITYTYAQRYSLVAALGLTTAEDDNDGNTNEEAAGITYEQAAQIQAMLDEIRQIDPKFEATFMDYVGAKSVAEIHPAQLRMAMISLEKKRRVGK